MNRHIVTIQELREQLEGLPGDIPVVIGSSDHAYMDVGGISLVDAEINEEEPAFRPYLEYYGKNNMSDPDAPVITVCYIY